MNPCTFYKCLADDTRLKSILLLAKVKEACVCDLMVALELDQPKTSRHLALLRKERVLLDERRGKWVFYKLHPDLPQWALNVIYVTAEHSEAYFSSALKTLMALQVASATSKIEGSEEEIERTFLACIDEITQRVEQLKSFCSAKKRCSCTLRCLG